MRHRSGKKGFALASVAAVFFFLLLALSFYFYSVNRCQEPQTFSIGAVDSRFKVSKAEIEKIASDAGNEWNIQAGNRLLSFDKNSTLKIDLVYDQRQADFDQLNLATTNLEKNRNSVLSTKEKFDQLFTQFQADLDQYDKEASYWNRKGGAPSEIFANLEERRMNLNKRRDQLISMSKSLNLETDNYNSGLQDLQDTMNSKKNIIITQGLYIPADQKIEIYTFGNSDELKLVLMHELGHAIGLDHGQKELSIMYYLLGNQDLAHPVLTSEDIKMTVDRCTPWKPNFYQNIFRILSSSVE